MGSRYKYGFEYVYFDGTISGKELDDLDLAIKTYYSENDGPCFIRRGDEREFHIEFGSKANVKNISDLLKKVEINSKVELYIKEMICMGKLNHASYSK